MNNNELYHYGIKGMKWGIRRYQNYDGSYTKKGLERYNKAKEVIPISKRYVEEFNEARLKDINYSNVELGKQMLKDYDLNFKVGNLSDGVLGRIIENGRFGVKVY